MMPSDAGDAALRVGVAGDRDNTFGRPVLWAL